MSKQRKTLNFITALFCTLLFVAVSILLVPGYAYATDDLQDNVSMDSEPRSKTGGGYAASKQIDSVSYTTKIYDASNGLPTSDANFVLGSKEGYIWIGSYSGIFRYDGKNFDKITYSEGLTSGRVLFEDSRGRIWIGTNDNGVVVIDGTRTTWITYKDGLPASSIRSFAEDEDGIVYIGTTAGLCYADTAMQIHVIDNQRINDEIILSLSTGGTGIVYGQTKNGIVFSVRDENVAECYSYEELGLENKISNILADSSSAANVYIGTENGKLFYGRFGEKAENLKYFSVAPLKDVHWINSGCGLIWVSSGNQMGYLGDYNSFHLLDDLPAISGIEMTTTDYQGNLWIASSTQGVIKIVSSNFTDLSQKTHLARDVINSTCMVGENLYIATNNGLQILDRKETPVENELTDYLQGIRIRCLMKDSDNNLWISTFGKKIGLVCYSEKGRITGFTTENGMPGDEVRCTIQARDGSILAGTNMGLAQIKEGIVTKVVDSSTGIRNTIFLTVAEGESGQLYVGTDGDGIYEINDAGIRRIGRDEGLSSDVVMRIKRDEERDLYWIVTSNSIQYMKDGAITLVSSFPYNNNFDLFFDNNDDIWVLSSNGLYMVSAQEMIQDEVSDYRLYTMANGLSSAPTSNSYSELDESGNLYICGKMGVCRVNIDHFFDEKISVQAKVKAVYVGDKMILPDPNGNYTLPSDSGRVRVSIAVPDYSLSDPPVRIYIEGDEDDQILVPRSEVNDLEFSRMAHGEYLIHVQVLDHNKKNVLFDESCRIVIKPKIYELTIVRLLMVILVALLAGLIVWRVMQNTVIRNQYDEIKKAKEDAERANSAKTRFLANISHEIRTPINTIMGMNEMILREDPTDVPKGYFMSMMNYAFDIRNASETLLGLINDLLDISRIESGKMHLVEQEYDIQDLLRSVVSMIRVKSTEKELMFDVIVDELMPKKLYGDAGKIKQIVLNLLTNAVKYTGKGGVVLSVSLDEKQGDKAKISFSVKDTGIGVKAEDMDKLFTAYERLDEQKNSGIQGTGLGLDISRRFALLMNGSLTCESVYGEGSEFILSLEQTIVDASPLGIFIEHDEKAAKGPYVPQFVAPDADVLVVDDNPMNLNVIKGLLKATRIFVTTATSGEDCLEKMKTTKFNIVLLDHMMPGMDGIETVAHIRESDPDIPVYALTANFTAGEDFYVSKGFTGYLSKPIDSLTLEKTIMKHLPPEIMLKPEAEAAEEELSSIPKELEWIKDVEGIEVDEGIKNSGGISQFIFSLKLFLDTIDGNSKVISDAYEAGDIRLYTIKVHALKSSCRIIGATGLSKLAERLEEAGNKNNNEFIDMYTDELLQRYAGYKEKLKGLSEEESGKDDAGKDDIAKEELSEAYAALNEMVPQMDYDAVEMILGELKAFRLPEKDKELVKELSKLLKVFDWEKMEELIKKRIADV